MCEHGHFSVNFAPAPNTIRVKVFNQIDSTHKIDIFFIKRPFSFTRVQLVLSYNNFRFLTLFVIEKLHDKGAFALVRIHAVAERKGKPHPQFEGIKRWGYGKRGDNMQKYDLYGHLITWGGGDLDLPFGPVCASKKHHVRQSSWVISSNSCGLNRPEIFIYPCSL